jgi:F-type H+-transporting ATPase subunit gamma
MSLLATARLASRALIAAPVPMTAQTRNMASLKDLAVRMKSVASVKKITASMKTVAASKLKSAELRKDLAIPFYEASAAAIDNFAPVEEFDKNKKTLFIVVTSDKGLCGSVNSTVIRHVKALFKKGTLPADAQLVVLGDKGRAGLAAGFSKNFLLTANDLDKKPLQFSDLEPIADVVVNSGAEQLGIITNKFLTVLAFDTQTRALKPISYFLGEKDYSAIEFDGENEDIVNGLYQYNLQALLYSSLVENQAVELGARMTSMDNATRNAGDMLQFLTISYNKKRQAAITTELVEIISGAQSLEQQAD